MSAFSFSGRLSVRVTTPSASLRTTSATSARSGNERRALRQPANRLSKRVGLLLRDPVAGAFDDPDLPVLRDLSDHLLEAVTGDARGSPDDADRHGELPALSDRGPVRGDVRIEGAVPLESRTQGARRGVSRRVHRDVL